MKKTLAILGAALLACTSCMTSKEYMLRKQDMEIKAAHPSTYQPIVLKGPLTIDKDASIQVTVPNMPYEPTSIPDGQAIQASVIKDVITTGALAGTAAYGIHEAGKVEHVKVPVETPPANP